MNVLDFDFKKRSVGHLPAPDPWDAGPCAKCGGTENEHATQRHHSFVYKTARDEAPEAKVLSAYLSEQLSAREHRVRADAELVEKLATSEEREATLKLLRKFVDIHPVTIGGIIRVIELGAHRGR